jgi:hypothetical protein
MELNPSYSINFTHSDLSGKTPQSGEAKAILDSRTLTINKNNQSISIPYFEIQGIVDEDYSVSIFLFSGERITLNQIGYEYENFLSNLYKNRNELLLKYMLMEEANLAAGIESNYKYNDEYGDEREGICEARIYESAVVILPNKTEPIRIPLSYINDFSLEDYTFTLTTELKQKLNLSQMGEKTDFFNRSLIKAFDEMKLRTLKLLVDAFPEIDQQKLRLVIPFFSDGKSVSRSQIESISPPLWHSIEKKFQNSGLNEEYNHLKSLSNQGEIWVGIKRGLMGEMTGEYIWFMTPIFSEDPNQLGNALIIEAASEQDSGIATYIFRIMDREIYRKGIQEQFMRQEAHKFMNKTNQCMIEINFRREPIYLSEDKLLEPENEKYLYATKKLDSLKHLRKQFIGRIIHSSPEQWNKSLEELLTFNIRSIDNEEKWRRS